MAAPAAGKRAQNKEQRRQEALLAARELIAEGGVEALSMRRLALVTGCSVNTLYALFGDKDGVFGAVVADGMQKVAVKLAADSSQSPLERAEALVKLSAERIRNEAAFSKPMYRTLSASGPASQIGRQHAAQILRGILSDAISGDILRPDVDADLLTENILQGFMMASMRWAHDAIDLKALEAEAMHALYVGLAAGTTTSAAPQIYAGLASAQSALRKVR